LAGSEIEIVTSGGDRMGYQCTHPGYNVRVDGIELGPTRFAIQATVDYQPQLTRSERERFIPRAQLELLLAILGEWERAVRLGARVVRVAVLGDGPLERFLRGRWRERLPDPERVEPMSPGPVLPPGAYGPLTP
jgi:hypothetical protein